MRIEDPGRVHRYVCRLIDLSLTREFLRRWVAIPVLERLPIDLSPDRITLTGLAGILVSAALLFLLPGELRRDPVVGRLVPAAAAVLLFCYAVADQLDGMQAVRQGRSNPLGDFVDHWVDAVAAAILPVALASWFGLPSPATLALALSTTTIFWMSTWDAQHREERLLPGMGGLEAIMIGIAVLLAGVVGGPDALQGRLLGVPAYALPLAIGFASQAWIAARYLRRAKGGYLEIVGFGLSLVPLVAWYSIAAVEPLVFLLIGLCGVKHIADQQQRQLLGAALAPFDARLVAGGLFVAGVALFSPDGQLAGRVAGALGIALAIGLICQAIRIWRFIERALGASPQR